MVLSVQQTVALVGSLTVVAGPYLFGRFLGGWLRWRGRSRADSSGSLRVARILTTLGLAFGAGIVAPATAGLVRGVWESISLPALFAIIVVLTIGLTTSGWATFRRGLAPFLRDRRAGRRTVPDWLRRRRRILLVVFPTSLVVVLLSTVLGYLSVFEMAIAWLVVSIVHQGLGLPYSTLDSSSYCFFDRDPTEPERDRIEACYTEFDRDLPRIRVRTDMSMWPAAFVTGSGSLQTLTVAESLLDDASEETLGVALAIASEQGRRRFPRRFLMLVVLPGLFGMVFGLLVVLSRFGMDTGASVVVWLALFLGCVGVVVGAGKWLRASVFEADAFAAKAFGPEAVQDALQKEGLELTVYSQSQFDLPLVGRTMAQNLPEPPLSMRLRRLDTTS